MSANETRKPCDYSGNESSGPDSANAYGIKPIFARHSSCLKGVICLQPFEDHAMYMLIGILCGLAIYNSVIIQTSFPLALYKKLLNRYVSSVDKYTASVCFHACSLLQEQLNSLRQ